MEGIETVKQLSNNIYGEVTGRLAFERISALIEKFPAQERKKQGYFSQEDVILITYGDSIKKFAIKRFKEDQTVYALTNISAAEISLSLPEKATPGRMTNLITAETVNTDLFTLKPYQYVWLTANNP